MTTQNTVNTIVTSELEKLGVQSTRPAKVAKPTPRQTSMSFADDDGYTRVSTVKTHRVKTKPKKSDPEMLDRKLGAVFMAITRMQDADFSKAHGKADATIKREKWSEFTQAIGRMIGIAMDARGLQWKSGHEWSLERGDLVRHIEEFILENAVYVDETDRKYLITAKK